MNSFFRLFIPLAVLTMLSACSLPLKVTKVKSMAEPVKGVRYFLKRPSYVAGLEIDFDKAKFLDTSKLSDAEKSERAIKEKKMAILNVSPDIFKSLKKELLENQREENVNFYFAKDPWIKGDQIKNNIYCVQMSDLRINLQQKMEGTPILFEAESRTAPPHWFADSESSITLDDNGYLTAIMAGEDDKSLEFIQAVASLAVKAATLDAGPSRCLTIDDDNFKAYVTRYFKLTARKINLEEKLNETYQKIEMKDGHVSNSRVSSATKSNINNAHVSVIPDTPKQMKLRFELINLLKEEITSIDDELKKLQYELPRQFFEVKAESGEVIIQPKSGKDSEFWLTFTLTRQ